MPTNADSVNLGNPNNARRDAAEQNNAKVTNADHPRQAGIGADDLYDDAVQRPTAADASRRNPADGNVLDPLASSSGRTLEIPTPVVIAQVAAVMQPGNTVVPPVIAASPVYNSHELTQTDPDVEMVGESTSRRDPLSGESGTHPLGVGMGAAAGGAAVGAASGFMAGAVAGPLGAAFGIAAGTVIGAIAGGYAGKGLAEKINPTTEDHYWRSAYTSRAYVPKGAKYEEFEPAYVFGIQMREWLIDKTWEEAEPTIRSGWEASEHALVMNWEQARPAIQDAWDHLTPEPGEPEVTEAEKLADE